MPKDKDSLKNTDQNKLSINIPSGPDSSFHFTPLQHTQSPELRDEPSPELPFVAPPNHWPGDPMSPQYPISWYYPPSIYDPLIHTKPPSPNFFIKLRNKSKSDTTNQIPQATQSTPYIPNEVPNPSTHISLGHSYHRSTFKRTLDQATQTDASPENKVAQPPTPPKNTYDIVHSQGYLIVNGIKYIPKPPSPLQQITETQDNESKELKSITTTKSDKPLDTKFTYDLKKEKASDLKPTPIFENAQILNPKLITPPEKNVNLELKPSISLEAKKIEATASFTISEAEDSAKLNPAPTKVEQPTADVKTKKILIPNDILPPEISAYKMPDTTPKVSNPIFNTLRNFTVKLSGGDSSDEEFADI